MPQNRTQKVGPSSGETGSPGATGTPAADESSYASRGRAIKRKYGKPPAPAAAPVPALEQPQEEPYRDLSNTWKVYQLWSDVNTQAFVQQKMREGLSPEQAEDAAHATFAAQLRAAQRADGIVHGEVDARSLQATAIKNFLREWNANALAGKDVPPGGLTPEQMAKIEEEGKRQAAAQASRVLQEAKNTHQFLFAEPLPEHVPRKKAGIQMPAENISAVEMEGETFDAPSAGKPKNDVAAQPEQKSYADMLRDDDAQLSQLERLKSGVKRWNAEKLRKGEE